MYVVAGATGNTGSVAADTLLAGGKEVTVIVRTLEKAERWRAKGAQAEVASLDDTSKTAQILSSAEGAYLLIPPNLAVPNYLDDRRRLVESMAKAVGASRIPHVVFMSSAGGQLSSGTGLILINHMGEEAMKPVAKNLTILRPGSFAENWEPVLGPAKTNGVLRTFHAPQQKLAMISTADVGRFAAEALLDPPPGVRILDLAGPQEYSPEDLAYILSSLFGREVRVVNPPISSAVPAFMKAGFAEDTAKLFEEMYVAANSGKLEFENSGTELKRGTSTPREVFEKLLKKRNQTPD